VPTDTSDELEGWWKRFGELHAGWELRTWREPLDPGTWPLTSDLWPLCGNGAQKAGLIRLEALVTYGGIYVDSDVEPYRSFAPLLHVPAFAAWEDETVVPDAVLGAEPAHPAFREMLAKARNVIDRGGSAWQSGPGVATAVLPERADVLLLPPGAFYPHHYLQQDETVGEGPWVFCRHYWHGSWLSEPEREQIERGRALVRQPMNEREHINSIRARVERDRFAAVDECMAEARRDREWFLDRFDAAETAEAYYLLRGSSLLEAAWGIIANAWGGHWSQAPDEWRRAAEQWRDTYHAKQSHEQRLTNGDLTSTPDNLFHVNQSIPPDR
jgi:hypothetical protein